MLARKQVLHASIYLPTLELAVHPAMMVMADRGRTAAFRQVVSLRCD
jgi:hypothetical protein